MTDKKEEFTKQFGQYKFWVGELMVMEKLDLVWKWIDKNFTPKAELLDKLPHERVVSLQNAEDDNYKRVFEKYGETHLIEKRMGTSVDITKLKDNESVCWGDGVSYHFLLTKK